MWILKLKKLSNNKTGGGMETIKSIETTRYDIKLFQTRSGMYYVAYNKPDLEEPVSTDGMKDFNTAMHVFEVILQRLEGQ